MGRCGLLMLQGLLLPVLIVISSVFVGLLIPDTYLSLKEDLKKALRWEEDETADIVYVNATIWTGNPRQPWAEFMAVVHGQVSKIGNSSQIQFAVIGTKTKVVDLGGRFVVPGFIDSHVHFISGGLMMRHVDLGGVHSCAQFTAKLRLAAQGTKNGHWILGSNWNNENWGGELPKASWIDSATVSHPVWVCRQDWHMCLANSVAMELANITQDTPEPQGGTIQKDIHGGTFLETDFWLHIDILSSKRVHIFCVHYPTASVRLNIVIRQASSNRVFVDTAMSLVTRFVPKPSLEERRAALIAAGKLALARGVTSVVDFGRFSPGETAQQAWDDFNDVYMWAEATGTMCVRVSAFLPLETWPAVAALVEQRRSPVSHWLHVGGVKAFADGSLGSGSALFHEAYADDNTNYGLHVSDPDWLLEAVLEADNAGLQVAVHAIGDAANDQVLAMFDTVKSKNGHRDRRFRIEHAQHLSGGAPRHFGASSVIASVQPYHLLDDAEYASRKLGDERALQSSYLFNSLLGNGTQLALGSDWPVSPLDPLRGIQAATRRTPNGWQSPWIPFEIISSEAALTGYTVGAAYASFMDAYVGSLSPGKYADFVVLSHDHLIESDAQSVLATYIGGLLVHNTSMVPSMKSSIKQGAKEALYWKAMVLRCVLGAIALAAAAQVCIYRPGNPVPITLQSLAVLALSVVLGSHLGMGAVLLYLLGGACGLPIFAGGSSGHHILLTEKSSGYLWGFLLAAWLAGHASGKDITGLFWLSAASLTVLAVGGMRLAVIIGWRTAWQVGVAPFLLEALIKALLVKFGQVVYCYICGTSSQ